MDFDAQILHSVEEIGQEAWDHLSGEQPFANYRWYRFGEAVLTDDVPPTYIILSHRGEPVARATLWLHREEFLEASSGVARRLLAAALGRWPLLMCQSPLASTSGLVLPDPPLRDAALKAIAKAVQDQARQCRASFIVIGYLDGQQARYAGWPASFQPLELPDPMTYLPITWPDFESYLKHLTRKRRKHYRQHCKYATKMEVEITLHPTVTDVDGAMALIEAVARRYKSQLPCWTRRILKNAGMVDAVWVAARVGERLVGCELMLGEKGVWNVMLLGHDHDFPYVYFLLGYADIRCAIEEKKARILRWSCGAYEAKQRLGFQLEDSQLVFAGRGSFFQGLGYSLAKLEHWMAERQKGKLTEFYEDED